MIAAIFWQTLLVIPAGILLFFLWRRADPGTPWLRLAVALGLVARAVAGQLLFWISWAELPIGRSLQIGDGLWFFAMDASMYQATAVAAARNGLWAIVQLDRGGPSVMWVQTLAFAIMLLGEVTSVGLLLNLFCYLGTIAVIVHWNRQEPQAATGAAIAIAAISLTPVLMLWSLQPLKDGLFMFLFISFIAACAAWQRAWLRDTTVAHRLGIALLMTVLLFAIAAIRWYIGFTLMIGATILLAGVAVLAPGRKWISLPVAIVAACVLVQALAAGAGPYIPPPIARAFDPRTAISGIAALPSTIFGQVEVARTGFDNAGGDTLIRPVPRVGPAIAAAAVVDAQPAPVAVPPTAIVAAPIPPVASPTPLSPADVTAIERILRVQRDGWKRRDFRMSTTGYWRSAELVVDLPATTVRGWDAVAEMNCKLLKDPRPAGLDVRLESVSVSGSGNDARAAAVWATIANATAAPVLLQCNYEFRRLRKRWTIVRASFRAEPTTISPPQLSTPAAPASAKPAPPAERARPTRGARIVAGLAAIFVPQTLARSLGLFDMGGGRGMAWFTDVSTLVFDLLAAVSLVFFLRRRNILRSPVSWMMAVLCVGFALLLAYTVANFGTLFRLRDMLYFCFCLLPLVSRAAAWSPAAANPSDVLPGHSRPA